MPIKAKNAIQRFPKKAIAVLLAAMCCAATAQESEAVIKTESGIDLLPALNTGIHYDNNVLRDEANSINSFIRIIAPSLKANLVDGANTYTLQAAFKDGYYFSSKPDNYTDGYLSLESTLSPAANHQFKLKALGNFIHEDRGTGVYEGSGNQQNEVTKYASQNFEGEYQFGASSSKGKLFVNTRMFNKDYHNFRDVTQYRDHDIDLWGTGFKYQSDAGFRLVTEMNTADVQFKKLDPKGDRDNRDNNYRLGTEWDFTSITTGIVKFGYQSKNFVDAKREHFHGFAWETILQWQPLSYSGLDLAAGRRAKDLDAYVPTINTNTDNDFIIETSYSLGWNHQWSETYSSKLAYEFQTNEYNRDGRKDIADVITIELLAKPTRWLKMKAFANIEDRQSNIGRIVYDRQVIGLELDMTL